ERVGVATGEGGELGLDLEGAELLELGTDLEPGPPVAGAAGRVECLEGLERRGSWVGSGHVVCHRPPSARTVLVVHDRSAPPGRAYRRPALAGTGWSHVVARSWRRVDGSVRDRIDRLPV